MRHFSRDTMPFRRRVIVRTISDVNARCACADHAARPGVTVLVIRRLPNLPMARLVLAIQVLLQFHL